MQPDLGSGLITRPETARTFFALWPAQDAAAALAALAKHRAAQWGGRVSRTDTLHLTLAFLGAVPVDQLSRLAQCAAGIQHAAFMVSLDRIGYWSHNHLMWAGMRHPPEGLARLVADLQSRLVAAGFGVEGGARPWLPHVTLVRKLPQCPPPEFLAIPAPIRWPCQRFVLVRSRLSALGPDYEILAEFPLTP